MRLIIYILGILLLIGCGENETYNSVEYDNLIQNMKLSYALMDIKLKQKSENYPIRFKTPYEIVKRTNRITEKSIELINNYYDSESRNSSKLISDLKNNLDSLSLVIKDVERFSPTRSLRTDSGKIRVKTSDPAKELLKGCYKMLDNFEKKNNSKVDLFKLHMVVIDLEIKKNVLDELYGKDFKANFFQPVLLDNGDNYDFYFTATDTMLESKIIIGDLIENKIVKVKNAHAVIDKKLTEGKKIIFSLRLPDGTIINQPLK